MNTGPRWMTVLLSRIWIKAERVQSRIRLGWNKHTFVWANLSRLAHLEVEVGNRFEVPVRSGGVGSLVVGQHNSFGYRLGSRFGNGEILLQPRTLHSSVVVGNRNHFNNNVSVIARDSIEIGDSCLIGDLVTIIDSDFHELNPSLRREGPGMSAPTVVGNNVWIGSRAIVLKGVTIGDDSVIAPMSVVTRSIPESCLAAGVPARVIRSVRPGASGVDLESAEK